MRVLVLHNRYRLHGGEERAVELHGQAVGLAVDSHERLRALEEMGDDHDSAYHGEDAFRAYTEGLDIARVSGWGQDRARLCAK